MPSGPGGGLGLRTAPPLPPALFRPWRGQPASATAVIRWRRTPIALAGRPAQPLRGRLPRLRGAAVEAVGRAELATASSGLRFWRGLARSLPSRPRFLAVPLLPLWLLVWAGAASLVWLGRLLVEALGRRRGRPALGGRSAF